MNLSQLSLGILQSNRQILNPIEFSLSFFSATFSIFSFATFPTFFYHFLCYFLSFPPATFCSEKQEDTQF